MRQAGFLFIFVIFQNTDEATFFKSEKKTGDGHLKQGGPEEQ